MPYLVITGRTTYNHQYVFEVRQYLRTWVGRLLYELPAAGRLVNRMIPQEANKAKRIVKSKFPHFCCYLVSKLCPTLLWPHEVQPIRLLCPWDSLSRKNTRMGCHALLQGIVQTLKWPASPELRVVSCIAGRFFTTKPPGEPTVWHSGCL